MKLTSAQSSTLLEVLAAQRALVENRGNKEYTPALAKEVYAAKLAEVGQFIDKETGGITKETYTDNKDNVALVAEAAAHRKVKSGMGKAAPKAPAAPAESKMRTPEQEAEAAAVIVRVLNARTELLKTGKSTIEAEEYKSLSAKVSRYVDPAGGLRNDKPKDETKKSSWERFKGFDGVADASKAHRAAVKAKAKDEPAMS